MATTKLSINEGACKNVPFMLFQVVDHITGKDQFMTMSEFIRHTMANHLVIEDVKSFAYWLTTLRTNEVLYLFGDEARAKVVFNGSLRGGVQ